MKNSRFAAVFGLLTTALLSAGGAHAASLRVAVASNFRPMAQVLAENFTKATGHQVMLSSASTGVLFNQLSYGAPFDLFLSADSERPQKLLSQGRLFDKPQTYAYGRLVFWQPGHSNPDYNTIKEWQGRLAMANPKTAPYGLAAEQVLSFFDLWGDGRIQLVQGANIQQAWQYVATGHVRAGFVALSQIRSDRITQDYLLLRDELYNPIRQDMAILKSGNTALAKQFAQFILAPDQQVLIQEAGYYPARQPSSNSESEQKENEPSAPVMYHISDEVKM